MAKKSTGLGKGLDSLIPDFYDEDFDSNSAVSLEDMLSEDEKQEESNEDIVENLINSLDKVDFKSNVKVSTISNTKMDMVVKEEKNNNSIPEKYITPI